MTALERLPVSYLPKFMTVLALLALSLASPASRSSLSAQNLPVSSHAPNNFYVNKFGILVNANRRESVMRKSMAESISREETIKKERAKKYPSIEGKMFKKSSVWSFK